MPSESRKKCELEHPYTLLAEALETYRAEVFKDDEARNRFLEHIQPLVQKCVGRHLSAYGSVALRRIEDATSFINIKLIESWIPKYLGTGTATKAGRRRILEGIKFLSESVRGYVRKFLGEVYDPRLVPLDDGRCARRTLEHPADRECVEASYKRMLAEHLALRRRVDREVVEKLMWYLAWEEYRSSDGVLG